MPYFYWLGSLLLVLSIAARVISYPVVTSDYTYFLSKWFDTLQAHSGLSAFSTPFSDYAPLYLYFVKLLTFLPVSSLYSIKTLSVSFDVLIAWIAVAIVKKTLLQYSKPQLFFIFALILSIPTVILNSSLWGQSDAIYAAGVLLSLYGVLTDRPLLAVTAFSFAISIKLQAIFFLPILLGYCLRKEGSAGYLIVIPLLFFLSIVPARLAGGSLSDLLLVYFKESGEYTSLSVSAQSVFALLGNNQFLPALQKPLFYAGLGAAGLSAICIAAWMFFIKTLSSRKIVLLSLLSVLILPYLLPRMHERYFYCADLLSVLYACYNPREWYLPLLIVGASTVSYMVFLSQVSWFSNIHINLLYPSVVVLIALVLIGIECYRVVVTAVPEVS